MSNLIYGPDGNPIPQENEDTSSQPAQAKEEPKQNSTQKESIPYPLPQSHKASHKEPYQNPYGDLSHEPDSLYTPPHKGPMEICALASGIVAMFMIGYSNYYTVFIMFAASLCAIILGSLSIKNNGRSSSLPIAAIIMGIIGLLMFLMTVIAILILVSNPDIMDQFMELCKELYGNVPNQPIDIQDLF